MSEQIIYNKIGKGYNATRKADPYIADRLYALLAPVSGGTYLDIGCGTGNYTIKLTESGLNMVGIDPSTIMLNEAKQKSNEVTWLTGSAEAIPLPDNSINGAIATFTTHHWTNPQKAFTELDRILTAGSPIVILTFTPEQEHGYWLRHYFPEMIARTVNRKINYHLVIEAALNAGFKISLTEKYFVNNGLEDLFLYSGKHNPEIYFDEAIQNGISSFAMTENKDEITRGLRMLREDINNAKFSTVQKQYENDLGDYLFVVLKK